MAKPFSELKSALDKKAAAETPSLSSSASPQTKLLTNDDKLKALKAVEAQLNKQFNTTTSIVRLGSRATQSLPSLANVLWKFDYEVVGIGGIPRGRIIELIGPESSGKTTFALHCAAQEQKRGELVAYVDVEHALDPFYMKRLGVDTDNLLVSQPDSAEQALETVDALVDSRAVSLIIVDSVASLSPQAELDGEMGDSHMGLLARFMSQAMRKLRGKCAMNQVTVIFINQIREKIGVMFGSNETTPGGRALKFYASLRLDVRRVSGENGKGLIKSGDVLIGHQMRIRAIKNKVGPPARSTEVDLIYGVGFDAASDFITYAKNVGAIEQAGSWFKLNGENIGQGFDKTKQAIKDDPELFASIQAEVAKAQAAQREADAQ